MKVEILLFALLALGQARWTLLSPGSPAVLSTGPLAHPGATVQPCMWYVDFDTLYVFEGNHMWKYEVEDKRWLWQPDVPSAVHPRQGAAHWTLQNKLYLYGGTHAQTGALLSDAWYYDTEMRTFVSLPAAPVACTHSAWWKHETSNKLYVWGGRCGGGNQTSDALYSFNVNAQQWQTITTLGDPRPSPAERVSATVVGNMAYLYTQDQLWNLDLTTLTWAQSGGRSPPGPQRFNHVLWTNHANQVALYGGQSGSKLYTDTWFYAGREWHIQDTGNGPVPTTEGAGAAADSEGNLYYFSPADASVWREGKLTVGTIMQLIQWKLDSATLAATAAAIFAAFSFFFMLFLSVVLCIRGCIKRRRAARERGPLSMAVLRRDQDDDEVGVL